MAAFGAAAGGPTRTPVPQPPPDTVTSLRFSPTGENLLLAASWAGDVRVWQTLPSGAANAVQRQELKGPVLDACWGGDGRRAFTAGSDNLVHHWDFATNSMSVLGTHAQPARCVAFSESASMAVSGGWDKQLRYWDPRSPPGNPAGVVEAGGRVYALDARGVLLVAGLADRALVVYDVRKPTQIFQQKYSQLKWQTRSVATFPDCMGYVVGSVGGRASVDHVRPDCAKDDFTFACHAADKQGHAVNAIRFHRQSGAFVTAGSDGCVQAWDKANRQGLSSFPFERAPAPITDADFSHDGALFAFACGYDWSQGAAGAPANQAGTTAIILQTVRDEDFRIPRDTRANGHSGHSRGRGGDRGGRGRGRGRRNDRGRGRGRGGGGGGGMPMR